MDEVSFDGTGDEGEHIVELLTAGFEDLVQRFDEAAALFTLGAERQFPPDHRVPQSAFAGVFSIMPFHPKYDDTSRIIKQSARECGLLYVRGNQPGRVMPQILDDIERAAVTTSNEHTVHAERR